MAYATGSVTSMKDFVLALSAFCSTLANPYTINLSAEDGPSGFESNAYRLHMERDGMFINIRSMVAGKAFGTANETAGYNIIGLYLSEGFDSEEAAGAQPTSMFEPMGIICARYGTSASASEIVHTQSFIYHLFDDGNVTSAAIVLFEEGCKFISFGALDKLGQAYTDGVFLSTSDSLNFQSAQIPNGFFMCSTGFGGTGVLRNLVAIIDGTMYKCGATNTQVSIAGSGIGPTSYAHANPYINVLKNTPTVVNGSRPCFPVIMYEDLDADGLWGVLGEVASVKQMNFENLAIGDTIEIDGEDYACFREGLWRNLTYPQCGFAFRK